MENNRMGKLEKTRNADAARWITVGDGCTRDFFEFHKDYGKKTIIRELRHGTRLIRDPKELKIFVEEYLELYTQMTY